MPSPMPARDLLALDIGGANLKGADGTGWTVCVPFALWREPERLAAALLAMVRPSSPRRLVATMTGEIADCFASRREGVIHIIAAVETAAAACAAEVGIYLLEGTPPTELRGRIAPAAEARERPLAAAAANWHALVRLAASSAPTDRCLLIDVGSTTTDIVAIMAGVPRPLAGDDAGRLSSGELVYTGLERTPVAAIVRSVPTASGRHPVAAERFADSRDAWLILGGLAEHPTAADGATSDAPSDTADGRPATRAAAQARLARMLLIEPDHFSMADARAVAGWIAAAQARQVARACARVARTHGWQPTSLVLSGHGSPLARAAIERLGWQLPVASLPERLGPAVARVAPAHALALIARGRLP